MNLRPIAPTHPRAGPPSPANVGAIPQTEKRPTAQARLCELRAPRASKIFIGILSYFQTRRKATQRTRLCHAIHHKLTTKTPHKKTAFPKTPIKNTGKSPLFATKRCPQFFFGITNSKSWDSSVCQGHGNLLAHPSRHTPAYCSRSGP